jgi:hypothetical protein
LRSRAGTDLAQDFNHAPQGPQYQRQVLQHHVKALDLTLCNMADVVDMTDELDDAAKKAGGDDADMRAHRQARAYRVLDTIVTAALRQSGTVETQLADFLAASPTLARHLARWQSDNP